MLKLNERYFDNSLEGEDPASNIQKIIDNTKERQKKYEEYLIYQERLGKFKDSLYDVFKTHFKNIETLGNMGFEKDEFKSLVELDFDKNVKVKYNNILSSMVVDQEELVKYYKEKMKERDDELSQYLNK